MFYHWQIVIKEEDRLASVIAEIDEDVKIVPRAAFVKTPTGETIANRSFEGIVEKTQFRTTVLQLNVHHNYKKTYWYTRNIIY